MFIPLEVSKHKLRTFEHAQSISKQLTGSVYIGNGINYFLYLPDLFPRGLTIDLKESTTFPTLTLSMYIGRLGLLNYLYKYLLNCVTMWQGSWAGVTALCMEVG